MKARREPLPEALSWLDDTSGDNTIGEYSCEESRRLVLLLYKMGASEVVVDKIQTYKGFSSSDHLIVRLPREPEKRRRIYDWDAKRLVRMGYEPKVDDGAEDLHLWFD
jgi:hypothetical protein